MAHVTLDYNEFKQLINSFANSKPTQICLSILDEENDEPASLCIEVLSEDGFDVSIATIDAIDGNPSL